MSFPHGSFIRAISSLNTLLPRCVTLIPFTWSPGIAGRLMLSRVSLGKSFTSTRSEEHTSELQSRSDLVCRLLLEKKKKIAQPILATLHAPPSPIASSLPDD